MLESTAAALALLVVLSTSAAARFPATWGALIDQHIRVQDVIYGGCVFAGWAILVRALKLYGSEPIGIFAELSRIALSVGGAALLLLVLSQTRPGQPAGRIALAFFLVCFFGIALIRVGTAALTGLAWGTFRNSRNVLIIGTGPRARRAYRELRTKQYRCHRLLGFVDCYEKSLSSGEMETLYLGSLKNLETILLENVLDEVIIALPVRSCYSEIVKAIECCRKCGVEVRYPSDIFPVAKASLQEREQGQHMVSLKPSVTDSRLFVKRCVDIVCSLLALIVFSPLMLVISAAIKFTSEGPVFFVQQRIGLGRRRFPLYKFRTMVPDAEARLALLEDQNEVQGPVFKMRRDPRVTTVGALLRRTSLDELPQLLNVLLGQMSLVGPRPMSVRDVSRFNEAWLMRRFSVKPGLTCLWQINGRSNTTFTKWMHLDMQYIDNWSLRLDAKILAQTIPAVVRGSGAM
jgi:exopolysaccharide biosynthesis polyprenyl glycosylphosphotransferase